MCKQASVAFESVRRYSDLGTKCLYNFSNSQTAYLALEKQPILHPTRNERSRSRRPGEDPDGPAGVGGGRAGAEEAAEIQVRGVRRGSGPEVPQARRVDQEHLRPGEEERRGEHLQVPGAEDDRGHRREAGEQVMDGLFIEMISVA